MTASTGLSTVPALSLSGINLSLQARDVVCCSNNKCFVRMPADAITVRQVTEEDDEGEDVQISSSTKLISQNLLGISYLRPETSREAKRTFGRKNDRVRKNTLQTYYGALTEEVGPEFAAVITIWKNVNIIDMYRNAKALRISHLVSIMKGCKSIDKMRSICSFIFDSIKRRSHRSSVTAIGDSSERAAVKKSKEKSVKKKFSSKELHKSSQFVPMAQALGIVESDGSKTTIKMEKIDNLFYRICKTNSLINKSEMVHIGRKLRVLTVDSVPKKLDELADPENIMQLTSEEAAKLVLVANHLRRLFAAKPKENPRHSIDEIDVALADRFRALHVSPTLSTPPSSPRVHQKGGQKKKKSAYSSILPMGVIKVESDEYTVRRKSSPAKIAATEKDPEVDSDKDGEAIGHFGAKIDSLRPLPVIIVDEDPDV